MKTATTNNANGSKRLGYRSLAMTALATLMLAAPALAQPDMVVRVDNEVIENHTEFFFEDVQVGDTSAPIVVVLRNESSETLEFTENPPIMIGGGFPESFEVIQPVLEAGNTLSPNGSTAFSIKLAPQVVFQNLFTHVYIWTNASPSPFHLIFRGRGTEPPAPQMVLSVDGEELDSGSTVIFDETEVGQSSSLTFTVENIGEADLLLTDIDGNETGQPVALCDLPEFAVTQQPAAVVAAGGTTTFEVTFTPSEDVDYESCFFFGTNDADYEIVDVGMEGYGYQVEEEIIEDEEEDVIDEDEDQIEDDEQIDDNHEDIDDEYVEDEIEEDVEDEYVDDIDDEQNLEDEDQQIEDEQIDDNDDEQNQELDENEEELQDDDAERQHDDSNVGMAMPCGAGGGSAGLMSMALMAGLSFASRRRRSC